MKLSIEQIEAIAKLARLELTEDEKARYSEQLSSVLSYMDILNEVDTDSVEETSQVTGLKDVVREDEVKEISEEERATLIEQFSKGDGGLLKVKAVFTNED